MSITKANLAGRIHKALGINTRFTEATPEQISDAMGRAINGLAGDIIAELR